MMNRKVSHYSLACLVLLVAVSLGCSTTKVTVDASNPQVELSDYDTFQFFELEAEGDTSSTFYQNMAAFKSEVIGQMNARGLKQDAENPDLKINLGIIVEEKTQTRQTSLSDPGEWNYIGQRNYKWESKTIEVGTYKEGSITMHLVDYASNEAVWVGIIEGILPKNPEKSKTALKAAVASLFEKID